MFLISELSFASSIGSMLISSSSLGSKSPACFSSANVALALIKALSTFGVSSSMAGVNKGRLLLGWSGVCLYFSIFSTCGERRLLTSTYRYYVSIFRY